MDIDINDLENPLGGAGLFNLINLGTSHIELGFSKQLVIILLHCVEETNVKLKLLVQKAFQPIVIVFLLNET